MARANPIPVESENLVKNEAEVSKEDANSIKTEEEEKISVDPTIKRTAKTIEKKIAEKKSVGG